MKNVNKQKKICSNHASSFLFFPVNKSVKIEENPQFNAKNMISKIKTLNIPSNAS